MKKNSKELLDELEMPKPAGEEEAMEDLDILAAEGDPEAAMEPESEMPESSSMLDIAGLSDDELKEALKEAQARGLSIDDSEEGPEAMEMEQMSPEMDMEKAPAPKKMMKA